MFGSSAQVRSTLYPSPAPALDRQVNVTSPSLPNPNTERLVTVMFADNMNSDLLQPGEGRSKDEVQTVLNGADCASGEAA